MFVVYYEKSNGHLDEVAVALFEANKLEINLNYRDLSFDGNLNRCFTKSQVMAPATGSALVYIFDVGAVVCRCNFFRHFVLVNSQSRRSASSLNKRTMRAQVNSRSQSNWDASMNICDRRGAAMCKI